MASKSTDVLMAEIEHVKESVNEIKEGMKEFKQDFKEFIHSADTKYATKEEHKTNMDKINRIENAIIVLLVAIGGAVLDTVLKSVGLIK